MGTGLATEILSYNNLSSLFFFFFFLHSTLKSCEVTRSCAMVSFKNAEESYEQTRAMTFEWN